MNYRSAVAEARRLVKRSEEDQWRLAELTWEVLQERSTRQWAADIGMSHTSVRRYRQVWEEAGNLVSRPAFAEVYSKIATPNQVGQTRTSPEAIVKAATSEQKRKMVQALAKDKDAQPEMAASVEIREFINERKAKRAATAPTVRERKEAEAAARELTQPLISAAETLSVVGLVAGIEDLIEEFQHLQGTPDRRGLEQARDAAKRLVEEIEVQLMRQEMEVG